MTRDEVVTEIKRGLGYRSDKTDEIISKLRLAQIELEKGKTLPWFLILEDEEMTLIAGDGTFILPSNFIREVEDQGFPGQLFLTRDVDVVHPKKLPYDQAYSIYAGAEEGTPLVYSLRGSSLVFFPPPSEDITMFWSYYAKQDDLLTAATNGWTENAPDVLIGLAGMMIAGDLEHTSAQQKFAATYALASQSLFREIVARDEANMTYSLGGGH